MTPVQTSKMSNFRWIICLLLFLATTINYMDRQVLSLTWKDFIAPEFHWTDANYGTITAYFSIFYAVANLFAGKFIDWMGTKKGYLIAIFVWSLGACLHAGCGWVAMKMEGYHSIAELGQLTGDAAVALATISMYLFLSCRMVLALGEAGNFPAAIKVTAEYFPKKDRAFSTSIFNSGASVGALAAPATIPLLARAWGWEMAFVIIGVLGFVWMGLWMWLYEKPHKSKHVNQAELNYIEQDTDIAEVQDKQEAKEEKTISFWKCFTYKQTWSFIVGKLLTDGVWWFFLFWAPAYFSDQFGYTSDSTMGILLIFTLYAIVTLLSIGGGYLPTYFVEKKGMNPYQGRMRAMLIFACFPLLGLLAQPMGAYSAWWPAIIIGLLGAGHQAWSANLFSTIGDMFPKSTIATITGIGAMAGGIGSYLINLGSGNFFDWAAGKFYFNNDEFVMTREGIEKAFELAKGTIEPGTTASEMMQYVTAHGGQMVNDYWAAFGFEGKPAAYMVVFSICAVAYLVGWCIMKALVPKYKPIVVE
ncbi:MAG: MFS transporter [Prevotellaceae bacterium]|nr:MFS transporter [Prevotellaceae bacterium]